MIIEDTLAIKFQKDTIQWNFVYAFFFSFCDGKNLLWKCGIGPKYLSRDNRKPLSII